MTPTTRYWRRGCEDRIVNVFRDPNGQHVIIDLPSSMQSTFDFKPLYATCTFISGEVVQVPHHLERAYHSQPPISTVSG